MTDLPLDPVDDGSALRKRRRQVIQTLQIGCVVTVSAGYLVCFADVRGSPFRHPLVHAVHVMMLWAALREASKATPESANRLVWTLFWFSLLLTALIAALDKPIVSESARGGVAHAVLHPTAGHIWWLGVSSTWMLMLFLFVVSLRWTDRETYAKELAYPAGRAHRFARPWLALPLVVGLAVAVSSIIRSGVPSMPEALPHLLLLVVGVLLFASGSARTLLVAVPTLIVIGADLLMRGTGPILGPTSARWETNGSLVALAGAAWIYAGLGIHGLTRVKRPT